MFFLKEPCSCFSFCTTIPIILFWFNDSNHERRKLPLTFKVKIEKRFHVRKSKLYLQGKFRVLKLYLHKTLTYLWVLVLLVTRSQHWYSPPSSRPILSMITWPPRTLLSPFGISPSWNKALCTWWRLLRINCIIRGSISSILDSSCVNMERRKEDLGIA